MIAWATQSALATSILILVVLLLRRPVADAFGARAAYALWLAPAVRAVLPPISLPALPLPAAPSSAGPVDYAIVTTPAAASGLTWIELLAVAWLAGAAIYLVVHWFRHQNFIADALHAGRPLDVPGVPYDVVASRSVEGPLATGLIHPLILVPEDFEQRFTPDQQRLALLHEQSHHRRGDIWASLVAMLLTAFLRFNPIAHMALRAFRRDMEAACDARVLADAGPTTANPYAETILRCVGRPAPRSLCALTAVDELKGRLMMLNKSHGAGRKIMGMGLAAGLTLGGLAFAVPAVAEEAKDEGKREVRRIEIRETRGDKDVLIKRDGKELHELAANCPGEKFEIGSEGGSEQKKENVKFVLCAKAGESLLPALEKAAAEIEKRDEMSAERKADILSKLRAKIAELRARG
jgi:beta-lactamase regulating signal transducer with metallopeptidase domain